MIDEDVKQEIINMPYEKMLWYQRYAPVGHPYFVQGEVGQLFVEVLRMKREADPAGHVVASKKIGW
jgi:hypothetical protein